MEIFASIVQFWDICRKTETKFAQKLLKRGFIESYPRESSHNPHFSWCLFVISATCPHRRSSWTMIPSNFREDCTGLLSSSLPTTLFANKQGIIDREAHVFHLRKFSLGMQVGKRVFPSQPMVQRFPNTWVHDRFINQWLWSPSYLCLLSLHYALIPMVKCP